MKKIDFKSVINKIQAMPSNKLVAYGAMLLGIILIILAIILW